MMNRLLIPGTDLSVSPLCLGAGGFGTRLRGADVDRLLGAFLKAGGNFLDTAHCYAFWEPGGLGASERELGAALRRLGAGAEVVIGSKGGHPDHGPAYRRPPDFLSETVIARDIEESLERLGQERIDLYYLHRDDGRTPVAEILGILNREVERGRLRYLGASNWSVARVVEANEYAAEHGLRGFAVSQVQWSLARPTWSAGPDPTTRSVGAEEITWHAESGVPLVCYSATAGGYFGGRDRGGYATPANRERRQRAQTLARQLGCTPTQVALAWLMHQPARAIPLFSTTRPEHLEEALGSLSVSLTPEQVRWVDTSRDA